MKRRWLFPGVSVATFMLFVSACSDGGMSVGDGKREAQKTRRPVAEAYWKVYHAIDQESMRGIGKYIECPGKSKDSVIYQISTPLLDPDRSDTSAEYMAKLKNELSTIGWNLQPVGSREYSATVHGVKVSARSLEQATGQKSGVLLYAQSKCADVGNAKKEIVADYAISGKDVYDPTKAETAPVPTGFADPHAVN